MSENKIMRILREAHGYSQEYVGAKLGIGQNTYSKLEAGKIKLTVDRMKQLSDLYKVEPDYFVSSDLPVINYNTGVCSKGVVNANTFYESEQVIKAKDDQIKLLSDELSELRKTHQELLKLLNKLTSKP